MSFKQIPFDFSFAPSWDAGDFLISHSNRQAADYIHRWPEWRGQGLYLYGPKGSGKTHLARTWMQKAGASLWPSREQSAILVDGLDGIDEEALFHAYNALKEKNGTLVVVHDQSLKQTDLSLNDLRSRLMTLPAVQMFPPDDSLLAALLIKQFQDRQLQVDPDVVAYVLPRLERSGSAVADFVQAVDRAAITDKRAITIPLVKDVLAA